MSSWPDARRFELINHALEELIPMPEADRQAFLAAWSIAHSQDLPLLQRLLTEADSESVELERVLGDAVLTQLTTSSSISPTRLGEWQLGEWLGRGGMAEVWLGIGSGSHHGQRAAIKRMATGLDTPELRARFEQERRILASLDDPRIARLLDGGVADDGRPWLAMELIDGERIDLWCDARKLDVACRVRLVREVAIALHSAHRGLVVHRDIKPANVLVTADGNIKLLDFGIAKMLDPEHDPTAESATMTHSRVLTPEYASPEQFLGESITTAVDVYQLGLLLVELVTGVRPFASNASNPVELAHAVVRGDTPAASQLLGRAGLDAERIASIVSARNTSSRRMRSQLRGEFDAIVSCALARDPGRRYASTLQFAEDLDAWLQQRPLSVRAPSVRYRVTRFLARNWAASIVTGALVLVIVAYIGTILVQSGQINREAKINRLVRNYLVEVLREADPRFSDTPQSSAESVVEGGIEHARKRFAGEPELLAELLMITADVQLGRGNYGRAASLFGEALQLHRKLDPDDPRLTNLLASYGRASHYSAQYADAEVALHEAESHWYAQGAKGLCWISMALADVLHSRGKYDDALAVLERAAETQDVASPGAAQVSAMRGIVLRDSSRFDEAQILLQQSLDAMRQLLGPSNGDTVDVQTALALTEVLRGETKKGRGLLEDSIATHAGVYGAHHPQVGIIRHALAIADEIDGLPSSGIERLDTVLTDDYRSIAAGNVLIAYARLDRAWQYLAADHPALAAADLDSAEPVLLALRDGGHPRWASAQLARAALAQHRGDTDAAKLFIGKAVTQRTELFGPNHPSTVEARRWLKALHEPAIALAAPDAPILETRRISLLRSANPDTQH